MRADERDLLQPWLTAFARTFGAEPEVRPLTDTFPGAPGDLFTLTFPDVFDPPEILGGTGHFRHSKALCAHLARLGFGWNEKGRILTAPTPATFNTLLPFASGADGDGFDLRILPSPTHLIPLGRWMALYLAGHLPLHVAPESFYREELARGSGQLRWHLTSFAHDLTVHTQNYHRVPRGAREKLASRIERALPERMVQWNEGSASAPLTLTFFLDNDLNRYSYAVWCRCETPADFGRVFTAKANFDQLLGALDVRLGETKAGLGDVPSGDTNDMAPLAKMDFRVERG